MRRQKISNAKAPTPGKATPPAAAFEQQSSYSKSRSIRLNAVKKPSMHFASETHPERRCGCDWEIYSLWYRQLLFMLANHPPQINEVAINMPRGRSSYAKDTTVFKTHRFPALPVEHSRTSKSQRNPSLGAATSTEDFVQKTWVKKPSMHFASETQSEKGSINMPRRKLLRTKLSIRWNPKQSSFSKSQRTGLDAATSKEELVQINEEEETHETHFESQNSNRFQFLDICVPLYQAAIKGDLDAVKKKLEVYPDLVRCRITAGRETVLHIATASKQTDLVKELVKQMTAEDLELEDNDGYTAFCFAVATGKVTIAEEMVKRNDKLPLIRNSRLKITPLHIAAMLRHKEMVSYLLGKNCFDDLSRGERIELLVATISSDLYDIALRILKKDKSLATAKNEMQNSALRALARKPLAIGSRSRLSVWETLLNSCFKGICNKALMRTSARRLVLDLWREVRQLEEKQLSDHIDTLLFDAAELGNAEFLIILINSYPDIIWKRDKPGRSLFHIAVLYRQESVFNLIYDIGSIKDIIVSYFDENRNNILHLAGKLAISSRLNMVSGAALQMQRELYWFKEVEKIVPLSYVNMKNSAGKTPLDIFTETHGNLQKEGEKWMKDTANYCMLVATLIATVVFAAAFTVPGGNNQDTGTPIFLNSKWFMVFFISDAVALSSSSTSILLFLSILTSRYAERDFLHTLPGRLAFGLTALFVSIACMVAAFTATCFLVYKSEMGWLSTVVIASAGFPVALFVLLHLQLWADTIRSTCWPGFLFRPNKRRLSFSIEE